MENVTPLRIADVRGESSAQLLSLDGECEWFGCKVQHNSGPVITDAAKGILSGMSGMKADRASCRSAVPIMPRLQKGMTMRRPNVSRSGERLMRLCGYAVSL